MNVQEVVDTLRAARSEALGTAARCAEAIALFEGHGVAADPIVKLARRLAAKKQPSKPATKAKATAKPAKAKKAAPADDDEPRARKGHMPKVGVQQLYCATLKERQAMTGKLKAEAYRRIGPGEPLAAGTYDVRPSGDEDDSCVVLWREIFAEATT